MMIVNWKPANSWVGGVNVLTLVFALAACGNGPSSEVGPDGATPTTDGGDAGVDQPLDGSVDAPPDVPADAPDAPADPPPEPTCDPAPRPLDYHRFTLTVASDMTRTITVPTGILLAVNVIGDPEASATIVIRERASAAIVSVPDVQSTSTGMLGCASVAAGDYDIEVVHVAEYTDQSAAISRRSVTPVTVTAARNVSITVAPLPPLTMKNVSVDTATHGVPPGEGRSLRVGLSSPDDSITIYSQSGDVTPSQQVTLRMPLPERSLVPRIYVWEGSRTTGEDWEMGGLIQTELPLAAAAPSYTLAIPARVRLSGTISDPGERHLYLGTIDCVDTTKPATFSEAWFYQQYAMHYQTTLLRGTHCDLSPRYYVEVGGRYVYLQAPIATRERIVATADLVRDFTVPAVPAAPFTISGAILDEHGEGIPWKEINVIGTPTGVDARLERLDDWLPYEGTFSIKLPKGTYTVEIAPWS